MDDLLIIIFLILLNGVFSMSEIAMISARKTKLAAEAKSGKRSAIRALKLQDNSERFLSTIQIGITLIGILTGMYSGDQLARDLALFLEGFGVSAAWSDELSKLVIIIIVTYLSIVIGELVPKKIGLNMGYKAAMVIATPMYVLSVIAMPFVWILEKSTKLISSFLGINKQENQVTEDEIKSMVREGTETGEVQEVEQDIIERVLVLGDQDVESIMTHRKDVKFLDIDMDADEVKAVMDEQIYDAYPVMDGKSDDICGVVSLKELIKGLWKPDFNLRSILHEPIFYPESMTVYKALEDMKNRKISRAFVCDEFGSMTGVVTLKDILEGLVGTIQEKGTVPMITKRPGTDEWFVEGQCPFYDFLEHFEHEDLFEPNSYNTISGLMIETLGHIPTEGESIDWHDFHIEVVDMDGNRIDKLLVTPPGNKGGEDQQ